MSFKTLRQLDTAASKGITVDPADLLVVARNANNETISAKVSEVVGEALNDPSVQTTLSTTMNTINNNTTTVVQYTNPPTIGGQPLFAIPTNTDDGEHLVYEGTNGTNVVNKPFLKKALAGRAAPEVQFNQTTQYISFQDILDTFYRFSHRGNNDHYDTTSTGEQAWEVKNGILQQEENTEFGTGFGSLDFYSAYEGRVILRSADNDNDAIGFVIALGQDTSGNDETLSVIRSHAKISTIHGAAYRYGICYNFTKSNETWLTENEAALPAASNWEAVYDNSTVGNGDALKISRKSNLIEVWIAPNVSTLPDDNSSDWVGYMSLDLTQAATSLSDTWNDATRLTTVPLTTMQRFQQACRWGLIARSQPYCSWNELFVAQQGAAFAEAESSDLVFNLGTNETFQYNETTGNWDNVAGTSIDDFVDNGQMLYDIGNGTIFFKQKGILQPLISKRPEFAVFSANFTASGGMLGKIVRLDSGVTEVGFNAGYGEGWHCKFINNTGANVTLRGGGASWLNANTNTTGTITIAAGENFEAVGNGRNNGAGISIFVSANA